MSPRSVLVLSSFLLVLSHLAGSPAAAEESDRADLSATTEPAPSTAEELARLNRNLERIADLLERQTEGQRLDLALRRLAVESDRVTALEEELRTTQDSIRDLEDQRATMRVQVAMSGESVDDLPLDASAEQLQQYERMVAEVQGMMERLDRQVEEQRQRVLTIENELTARRADLQALQDRLDRQLEGM